MEMRIELLTAGVLGALAVGASVGPWPGHQPGDTTLVVRSSSPAPAISAAPSPSPAAAVSPAAGVIEGATMVADLDPDRASAPADLTAVAGQLFFDALVGDTATLWRSDGTAAGTMQVSPRVEFECDPEFCAYQGFQLTAARGLLFFTTRAGLWRSDGTDTGTVRIGSMFSGWLTPTRTALFFVSRDRSHGFEPWVSDGTRRRTRLTRDIRPGPADGPCPPTGGDLCYDQLGRIASRWGRAYFAADDGVHGVEPWVTDGTAAGTWMLRDIRPGRASGGCPPSPSDPCRSSSFVAAGGGVLFAADDGIHGPEPWWTDGTRAGTHLVRDLRPGTRGGFPSAHRAVRFGDRVVFVADDGRSGRSLWVTDGTSAGTRRLGDALLGPGGAASVGETLFFVSRDRSHGSELWRTDGTSRGTWLVADLRPGRAGSRPHELTVLGDRLYFIADGGDGHDAIWRTDGTRAGTVVAARVHPYAVPDADCQVFHPRDWDWDDACDPGGPWELTAVGEQLFFTASDGEHGRELWRVVDPG